MKQPTLLFAIATAAIALSGCDAYQTPATGGQAEAAEMTLLKGFDSSELSNSHRPQDDFFNYVNSNWLETTDIPPEWSSYGVTVMLYEQTEKQLRALIDDSTVSSRQTAGSDTQKIGDFYLSFMDAARAEDFGISPLSDFLERIDTVDNSEQLIELMATALTEGIQTPVDFYIDADAADTTQNMAYFWQDGLGLPDRDYYLTDNEELKSIRDHYVAHVERLFQLAGWPDGKEAADTILRLEARIAEIHWTRVQNRDRERIYNSKFSIPEAQQLTPDFDWSGFLETAGFGQPEIIVIAQADFFSSLSRLIKEIPIEDWKTYLRFKTLKAYAPYLNEAIVAEDFDFQRRKLRGQEEMRARWRRGVRLVSQSLGEIVGERYVAEYFPAESKVRMDTMISHIREAYRQSIDDLTWMSDKTKVAAQKKLAAFSSKIGYPEKWRDYSALEIRPDDLAGNVRRARRLEHFRQADKLSRPVDRDEWGMTPQTVNAYYRATMNEIVFPAAILQPPFFDANADDAVNYGAIGAVIGHEFSHGFDDQGRKFDGNGRLNDWWTEEDTKQYDARSAKLVEQYNAFQPLPDMNINGELTLGENIADLAGLIMAYRAYRLSLNGKEPPTIDGLSGDERFFIGYALSWRGQNRPEQLRERLLSDPHSPPHYRVIGALKNVPEFYSTFEVNDGDAMYLDPGDRVKIW